MNYKVWKDNLTNQISYYKGNPIPSFIELNLGPTCNRRCDFCPRAHGWRDSGEYMSLESIRKLKEELLEIGFRGMICICGFGEPLQHPHVIEVINTLKCDQWIVELVTNGDFLTREIAETPDHVAISMYDGEHQIKKFTELLTGLSFSLRERWQTFETLTNRSGSVDYGGEINVTRPCNYPLYYMFVNHNGNVYLCPQDWSKEHVFGNVFSHHLMDVWNSAMFNEYRNVLLNHRDIDPCKNCNTCGLVYGNQYQEVWRNHYDKS